MKTIISAKKIFTMQNDDLNTSYKYLILEDGRIKNVTNTLEGINHTEYKRVDYPDKVIYPGFNDSHMHFIGYGSYLDQCQLDQITSIDELIQKVKAFDHTEDGSWIIGRGWNQDHFKEKRLPNRYDLDQISNVRPVVLYRACGHIAVVNSYVINHLKIDAQFTLEGGHVDLDPQDQVPTGILRENALLLVKQTPNDDTIKKYILKAQKALNAYGITSVQSDDLIMVSPEFHSDLINLLESMGASGELTVRVYQQAQFATPENFKRQIELGYRQNTGNDFYKNGPVKILADGSLGARTAYLRKPYADDPTTRGILIYPEGLLREMVEIAFSNDIDVAIHGIGDGTISNIINTIEHYQNLFPRTDARNAIVHCQIMDQMLINKMAKIGLHALVQPVFLEYDMTIVKDRVGETLAKTSYAYKTMLENDIILGFGSDAPVEDPNPFRSLYYALYRERPDGLTFFKEEGITLTQALKAFMKDAAFFSYEEASKGSLIEGAYADFIVLDAPMDTLTPSELLNARVFATYVHGVCVYSTK